MQVSLDQKVTALVKDISWYCLVIYVNKQHLTLTISELHQFPGCACFGLQPKRRNSLLWCSTSSAVGLGQAAVISPFDQQCFQHTSH